MSIILPRRYGVSTHAAERFIERIIGREEYTEDDLEVARFNEEHNNTIGGGVK